ncbi:MAG: PQQ-dependent sugar dehydrogenase [Actinomycetota bacterium]
MTSRRRLAAGLSLVLSLAACQGSGEQARPTEPPTPLPTGTAEPTEEPLQRFDPKQVRLGLRRVAGGFTSPVLVTHAGDGSGRLFVGERGGQTHVVRDGRLLPEPFLDLSNLVTASESLLGEQGLLGMAFHPRYERNGRLFVNYTDRNGDTVVAEYRVSPNNPDRVDPTSARTILWIDQPFANHNGGSLVFGPDGYLYIGIGDGGSAGDPSGNGQRLDTLLAKLLRIDVDRGRPYGVPQDNPFVGRAGARPEIWAFGLRNPWRFSFDRETGHIWIGDVGQGQREEIDRTRAAGGGQNYGWNTMEGDLCFSPPSGCDASGLELPIAVYPTNIGCAVIGGHVYRGSAFPALWGGYFFADTCNGSVWSLRADGRSPQKPVRMLDTEHIISSFGEDEEGELYLTDLASGQVLQVTARPR